MKIYKFFSYGFIHFQTEEDKSKFYSKVNGREYKIGKTEKEFTIKFLPLKRKKNDYNNVILIYFLFII